MMSASLCGTRGSYDLLAPNFVSVVEPFLGPPSLRWPMASGTILFNVLWLKLGKGLFTL